jgi:hypothetical protein
MGLPALLEIARSALRALGHLQEQVAAQVEPEGWEPRNMPAEQVEALVLVVRRAVVAGLEAHSVRAVLAAQVDRIWEMEEAALMVAGPAAKPGRHRPLEATVAQARQA